MKFSVAAETSPGRDNIFEVMAKDASRNIPAEVNNTTASLIDAFIAAYRIFSHIRTG